MSSGARVAVVGAGIVGVATAIWLQRAGHTVTLYDREGVASATSYGNAGLLASSAVVPVITPGMLHKIPQMLLNPDAPLFVKWANFPRLIPFLLRFMANGRASKVEEISKGLTTLLADSVDQHKALAKGTAAEKYIRNSNYIYVYPDHAAYEKSRYAWELRAARGFGYREMNASDLAEHDPALAGRFGFGVECLNTGMISDPGAYIAALARHFTAQGGRIVIAQVTDVTPNREVVLRDGATGYDHVVITTGIWSKHLTPKRVPLEAERGYHLEFINPSYTLKSPLMSGEKGFGITPMDGRLRAAGIVELGNVRAKPSEAPFRLLEKQMRAMFPDLTWDRIDRWMGWRPSTPDSLPVIGSYGEGIWAGFGHQHVGLTGGPKTGRWLAQMIDGTPPNEDLSAFTPDRF